MTHYASLRSALSLLGAASLSQRMIHRLKALIGGGGIPPIRRRRGGLNMALTIFFKKFKIGNHIVSQEIQTNPEIAWAYHCNIAVPIMDAIGVSHEEANVAAAYVMLALFGVDITKDSRYEYQKSAAQEYHEMRIAEGG